MKNILFIAFLFATISSCTTVAPVAPPLIINDELRSDTENISDVGDIDSNISDPDVSDPDVGDPDVSDPDVSDPDIGDSGVGDPDINDETGCEINACSGQGNFCDGNTLLRCATNDAGCLIAMPFVCEDNQRCNAIAGTCAEIGCGDGTVENGENCDDGATISGDGCSATCEIERGWECSGQPSNCSEQIVCGDGVVHESEQCDDQNTNSNDGCSSSCGVEQNWNCSGEPSDCERRTFCGDGVVDFPEECDGGDNCSAECLNEIDVDACGNIAGALSCQTGSIEHDGFYDRNAKNEHCGYYRYYGREGNFVFRSASNQSVTITLNADARYNLDLFVYELDGTICSNETMTCSSSSTNSSSNETLTFNAMANGRYIVIADSNSGVDTYQLSVSCVGR